MTTEELTDKITALLYGLHAWNILTDVIVDEISEAFEINVGEICYNEGITYIITRKPVVKF